MNRHKIVWGAALMALLGIILGGCSKELARGGKGEVPGLPEKGQAVTFTVTTGVETYAVPAQDYEKSISTLQALLFDASGRYVTSGTPALKAPGSTSYTLPIATTGTYKMLLVANYTIPAGSLTGKSLSDVRAILVDGEPGMPNAFVMASTNIPDFTVTAGAMTPAGTINLERLAARIDVQSTLDKLTLSKITVKNRKTQSSLLAASSTNAYRTDGKEYGSFERFRKPATDVSMGQIYAYENSAASASSADGTSLVIETAYNGYAVKPLEVKLPQMKRNYIYSIQLMMGDEGYVPDPSDNPDPSKIKLTYNVRVVDWNNGQTFTVSEEELLKIFQKGAVSYAYSVQVTTTPDISSGVSADGGTVTVNATATKQKLVGGAIDPTAPAETITGGDKFSYTVTNGPVDWISISPTGIVTVSPNTTSAPRVATIAVSPKENPSASGSINITQLGKPVPPTISHVYALTGVSPASLTFVPAGSSQKLSITGTDTEMQNGTPTKTTPLTIADVTITKSAGADWLTIVDGTITAAENATTEARTAVLTISVSADSKQSKSVSVSQQAGKATTEYSITSVTPSAISFNGKGESTTISVAGTVVSKMNGKEVSRRDLSLSDITVDKGAGADWLTVSGATITATANNTGSARQATLTIRVKADSSKSMVITVSQASNGPDYSAAKYNPLAYVAKYNVTYEGNWDTNHTSHDHMKWYTAKEKYYDAQSIQGSTETYELPTQEKWQGILPYWTTLRFDLDGGKPYFVPDRTEQVTVAGEWFDATSDYMMTTMTVNGHRVGCTVALRFNGDDPKEKQYRSAWLYYYGTYAVNGESVNGLWIYCINIAGRKGGYVVNDLDQTFWDQNLSSAVVRFLPAAGYSGGEEGKDGYYWSCSYHNDRGYSVYFDQSEARVSLDGKDFSFSVRLFSLSPLD
ncbi:BACON domain-containing protein [uncultured Porphyromonas sp.]|uniref:BACON domain-containing protein n=3 Tax=Porphyromonas TaxID=836 RepID=UPI00261907BC|nr:BACON domain-containing carbohydrate-binding protein [uncultured Porphyromonas sp.]